MNASSDPRINALLQHKGSPVPLEPPDIYRDVAEHGSPYGALHNATFSDPPVRKHGTHSGYLNAPYGKRSEPWPARPEYHRGPVSGKDLGHPPLKPLYTEKLPKSPAFKSVAELAQRRRDRWSAIVARSGIATMVSAPFIALYWGTGVFPAGAFVGGLITFLAVCFISGNRTRL